MTLSGTLPDWRRPDPRRLFKLTLLKNADNPSAFADTNHNGRCVRPDLA